MTASQAIIDALYSKLVAVQTSGTLYSDLGGRIYGLQSPNNAALPHLVFLPVVAPVAYTFGGRHRQIVDVQLDLYGSRDLGLSALGTIEDKLFDLLTGFNLTVTGFDRGQVMFTNRMQVTMEEDAIRIMDEIRITAHSS